MAPGWRWSRTAARVINARPNMPSKNCVADLPVEFQNLPIMDSSCARCINATFYSIPQLAADAPRPGHVADHQHAKGAGALEAAGGLRGTFVTTYHVDWTGHRW